MTVKNKRKYVIYLDEETTEYVRSFLDTKPKAGGLSAFLDKYLARTAVLLKEHGDLREGKMTLKTVWKIIRKNHDTSKNQIIEVPGK